MYRVIHNQARLTCSRQNDFLIANYCERPVLSKLPLGFKRFDTATITISGIEFAEKIKKGQFKIGKLANRPATTPAIWAAILTA
jgi:hypothetical protein